MAKPLTKSKIITLLAAKCGTTTTPLSKAQIHVFFHELLNLAVKECKGPAHKFVIPNLCRAVLAHRKARIGRNPATGETIQIKAKTVVRLRPAKSFKDAILG
jgi:DNA-binding protein HU-beta